MAALPPCASVFAVVLLALSSAQALVLAGPREPLAGTARAVAVARGIAYVATEAGLLIFDASAPAQGYTPLGSHPGSFSDVEVRGSLAYLVGAGGLEIVDVRNPASPVARGALAFDRTGLGLDVVGSRAYVAVSPLGLRIVDVSNPAAPALLGALDLESTYGLALAAIAIEDGVAYLNSFIGAASVDVANAAAPALITWFDFAAPAQGSDLEVRDHILYATSNAEDAEFPSIRILDVTDPAAPDELARFDSFCTALALVGNALYCTDVYQLHVFDVSDASRPVPLGVLHAAGDGWLVDVALERGFAHVASGFFSASLQAVDARVRAFPARTPIDGPFSYVSVRVVGPYLYGGSFGALDVYDIREPASPSLVGSAAVAGVVRDVIVVGGTAYAATDNLLEILDVSDPTQPRPVASLPTPARSLARSGNRLYVGTFTGSLEIYDLQDAIRPLLLGSLALPPGRVEDLDLDGDVLYATTSEFGLLSVDISDPTSPRILGSFESRLLQAAAISGDLLYVGGLSGGWVLDAGDPAQLRQIGDFDAGSSIREVQIAGDRLYAGTNGPLQVLDISSPTAPVLIGGVDPGAAFALGPGVTYASGLSGFPRGALYAIDFGPEYAPPLDVDIDVRPGDRRNRVLLGRPNPLLVALLGSSALDVRDVDRHALALGPDGAPALLSVPKLVNRDRRKDLLSLFWTPDTGIAFGDTEVCLTGRLESGRRLRGCDAILTHTGCGRGYELALVVPLCVPLARAARRLRRTQRSA